MSKTSRAGDRTGFLESDLLGLSQVARDFLRHHPGEARIAVTAALEAAAVQFDSMRSVDDSIPHALKPFIVRRKPGTEMITVAEAAKRLGISRTTVYDWIENKRMVGWKATKKSTVIPAEQIVDPQELVPGLEVVLAIIPDARAAWRFLSEESPFFATPARPIDALKAGDIDAVRKAAQAHGEAFS